MWTYFPSIIRLSCNTNKLQHFHQSNLTYVHLCETKRIDENMTDLRRRLFEKSCKNIAVSKPFCGNNTEETMRYN